MDKRIVLPMALAIVGWGCLGLVFLDQTPEPANEEPISLPRVTLPEKNAEPSLTREGASGSARIQDRTRADSNDQAGSNPIQLFGDPTQYGSAAYLDAKDQANIRAPTPEASRRSTLQSRVVEIDWSRFADLVEVTNGGPSHVLPFFVDKQCQLVIRKRKNEDGQWFITGRCKEFHDAGLVTMYINQDSKSVSAALLVDNLEYRMVSVSEHYGIVYELTRLPFDEED